MSINSILQNSREYLIASQMKKRCMFELVAMSVILTRSLHIVRHIEMSSHPIITVQLQYVS